MLISNLYCPKEGNLLVLSIVSPSKLDNINLQNVPDAPQDDSVVPYGLIDSTFNNSKLEQLCRSFEIHEESSIQLYERWLEIWAEMFGINDRSSVETSKSEPVKPSSLAYERISDDL